MTMWMSEWAICYSSEGKLGYVCKYLSYIGKQTIGKLQKDVSTQAHWGLRNLGRHEENCVQAAQKTKLKLKLIKKKKFT